MPYRRGPRPTVHSDKHEITWSNLSQDASGAQAIQIVDVVQPGVKSAADEIAVGSKVFSIYFEFHFAPESTTTAKVIHWEIVGYPDGATPTGASLYYQDDRARIFKRGMEMLVRDQGTVFKRIFVVKIPKKMQRPANDFNIQLRYICSSAETINACGFAIYKEYS